MIITMENKDEFKKLEAIEALVSLIRGWDQEHAHDLIRPIMDLISKYGPFLEGKNWFPAKDGYKIVIDGIFVYTQPEQVYDVPT